MNMDFVWSGVWHGMLLVVSIIMVFKYINDTETTDENDN